MNDTVSATATREESPSPAAKTTLFGMQIPAELNAELSRISVRYSLTKSAVARLALERGLVVVEEQLGIGGAQP